MTAISRVRAWAGRHWMLLRERPANGRQTLTEIDATLKEIRFNGKRVTKVSEQMVKENNTARRVITENATNHNRT